MKDNLLGFWTKCKAWFLALSMRGKIIFGSVVTLVLIGAVVLIFLLNQKEYTVLFTGLSNDEAQSIVNVLAESGVTDYKIEGNDTVLVLTKDEANLKASLLMQGYPKSGFAYETYRGAVGALSTESDRNIAYLQDLQDRLSAVIRCFEGVKEAVVNIVPEEDRRYILDTDSMTSASAAVMLTMDANATLSNQQAQAISHLLARSVKGLDISNVAISDTKGNSYNGNLSDVVDNADASKLKLQLEEETNLNVRNQVMQVLVPLFGANNVTVAVNSTVDIRHTVGETTNYTEPEWAIEGGAGGRGIIGSQIYDREVVRDPDNPNAGVVGTETNSDINTYVQDNMQVNGTEPYIRDSGTIDYVIDSETQQVERWAGVVEDIMVSVTINSDVAAGVNQATLRGHIGRAAGILPDMEMDKISIYLGPFFDDTPPSILPSPEDLPFPLWWLYAAAAVLALIVALVIIIVIARKRKKKQLEAEIAALMEESEQPILPEVEEVPSLDIMDINSEKSMKLRKILRQFTEENPEIAAFMLRQWLREEELLNQKQQEDPWNG